MKRALFMALAAGCVVLAGCPDGTIGDGSDSAPPDPGAGPTSPSNCEPLSNADVLLRLAPTCEACHGEGSNLPLFESLAAFEQLLAYDEKYVVGGDPDASALLDLLDGQGAGSFTQMPLSGPTFAELETAEQTAITMAELRQWIENLPEPGADPFDFRNASTMRRLRAEQVLSSFNATLGLSDTDYFSSNYNGALNDSFPARSPDEAPYSYNYSSNQNQVYPRFTALGGPHWLEGKRRSNDITAPFLQTLVQMAQVRCRLAVKKGASDTAIFQFATRDMTSAQDAAAIRENIAYLFLRLLADPPSEEELDHLTDEVFKTYEDQGGETAWTAVCATLVRDPRWLSY